VTFGRLFHLNGGHAPACLRYEWTLVIGKHQFLIDTM